MKNLKSNSIIKFFKNILKKSPFNQKTISLITILIFLYFVINSILPYLFQNSNIGFEAEYNGKKIRISNVSLNKTKNKLQSELNSIENLLLQEFINENNELRDSLTKLSIQRRNDINKITDYINKLKIYRVLKSKEKQDLLIEIAAFLSSNPNLELDLGIVSQDLTFQKVTRALDSAEKLQANLFKENKRLIYEIDRLKRDSVSLEKEKNEIERLYKETIEQLKNLEKLIEALKKDTFNLNEAITLLTKERKDIKKRADNLEEDLKKIFPVRIDELVFEPINAKKRKDGSYKLRNMKEGFNISFKLNYNKSTTLQYDSVLIVYKIPNNIGEIIEKKQYKNVKIGSNVAFTFENIQSYGKGQYIVQIIHKKSSENIYVDKREFVAY